MSEHSFGGLWTAQKLAVLRKYLDFFPRALGLQPFRLVYIDTFAGSGKCSIVHGDGRRTIEGSAAIALSVPEPFHHYYFIEKRTKHVAALEELRQASGIADRVTVRHGDAAGLLNGVLGQEDWTRTRGVLLLDPYGLQCSWDMVKAIGATQALDVFFLVSLSGLVRNAANSHTRLSEGKRTALTRFLGTGEWESAWYQPPPVRDLFDDDPAELKRQGGTRAILQFVGRRMQEPFAAVSEPTILRNTRGAALYALYFAVSNRSIKAGNLAMRVHREILVGLA